MGACLTCEGALGPGDVVKGGRRSPRVLISVQLLYSIAKERRVDFWGGCQHGPERTEGLSRVGGETNARLCPPPLSPQYVRASSSKHTHNGGEIQQSCGNRADPSQGGSHPAHTGRSTLRAHPIFFFHRLISQPAVLQLLQARCVMQGAIARVHFRNLTYI